MDKVVHFEIVADDTERAQNFYQDVFGWKVNAMPQMQYALVYTGPTNEQGVSSEPGYINGGMMKRDTLVNTPVITIQVESIDESVKNIVEHGGQVLREKMAVGEMGFAAYFKDSEGNIMGLWESKQ